MLGQQALELLSDEGIRLHAYDDATGLPLKPGVVLRGHPTIGVGRALDIAGLSLAEAVRLLANDVLRIEYALVTTYSWFGTLDPVRQGVLCNLAYNCGLHGVAGFHRMLAAIAAGNFADAADELADSTWARQVQPSRSWRLIEQLRSGQLTMSGIPDQTLFPSNTTILGGSLQVALTLDPQAQAQLAGLQASMTEILQEIRQMSDTLSSELTNLQQAVAQATSVEQSAVTLIQGIPALIQAAVSQAQAAGATPEQLAAFNQLAAQLNSNSQSLASAVAAQQPAPSPAPSPAPAPAPTPSGP